MSHLRASCIQDTELGVWVQLSQSLFAQNLSLVSYGLASASFNP